MLLVAFKIKIEYRVPVYVRLSYIISPCDSKQRPRVYQHEKRSQFQILVKTFPSKTEPHVCTPEMQ